jgi:hypothetical protein
MKTFSHETVTSGFSVRLKLRAVCIVTYVILCYMEVLSTCIERKYFWQKSWHLVVLRYKQVLLSFALFIDNVLEWTKAGFV